MKKFLTTTLSFFLFATLLFSESIVMEIETEKHIEILDAPILGSALLAIDSDENVRWQTFKPYGSIMISNKNGIFQFEYVNNNWRTLSSKSNGVVKRVISEIRRIVIGDYGEDYEVSKENGIMVLTPKNSSAKNFISQIIVKPRVNSRVPVSVEFIEPSGDKSILRIVRFSENKFSPTSIFDESNCWNFKISK